LKSTTVYSSSIRNLEMRGRFESEEVEEDGQSSGDEMEGLVMNFQQQLTLEQHQQRMNSLSLDELDIIKTIGNFFIFFAYFVRHW
jgi:hypothetical protein